MRFGACQEPLIGWPAGVAALHRNESGLRGVGPLHRSKSQLRPFARHRGSRPRSGTEVSSHFSRPTYRRRLSIASTFGVPSVRTRWRSAPGQICVLESEVEALIDAGECGGFVVETPEKLRRIVDHFRSHLGLRLPVAPRCNAPWVSAVLESDGVVRPCFFHRPIGTVGQGRIALGSAERAGGDQLSPRSGCCDESDLPALRLFVELDRAAFRPRP